MSRQPAGVARAVFAAFISEGHLERHIRTSLHIYRERQEALLCAIKEEAQGIMEASPSGTGMYLVAWLNPGVDDRAAARAAAARGVDAIPLSAFSIRVLQRPGLVLGYAAYEVNRIRVAVKQLCLALSSSPLTQANLRPSG